MKLTLLVLAAGMGSRYGGLKQIDAIGPNGETIIDYNVYDAIRAGFDKVVFIIRKDIDQAFRETYSGKFEDKIEVDYVYQELDELPKGYAVPEGRSKPWGTGHALLMAKDAVKEPFVMINADDFYGPSSFQLAADFLRANADQNPNLYAMIAFELTKTLSSKGAVTRGVCKADDNGFLETVNESFQIERLNGKIKYEDAEGNESFLTGKEIVSVNMFGLTPAIFEHLEAGFREFLDEKRETPKAEFLIPQLINELVQKGLVRVKVLESHEKWLGVTYQEDKPIVKSGIGELIDSGKYPADLWGAQTA